MTKKKAIAFVAALWLLSIVLTATAAKASTRTDALKAAWYLKGEGDVVLQQYALSIKSLTCKPTTGKFVDCKIVAIGPDKQLCAHGLFSIHRFVVDGQWSEPKPCNKAPAS